MSFEEFNKEQTCYYKGEHYSVRDNGEIFRHAREGKILRKYDNLWAFGKTNKQNGYMEIASERVHRIVAFAFLGEPPTPQHVVDHIDTNRQNNRPENLRWLTKLENILKNPITLKRVIFLCGSIEAFLTDPSVLEYNKNEDPNFKWMRVVTAQEAKTSLERLSNWAKKENENTTSSGKLGEWIFKEPSKSPPTLAASELVPAITPNAVQKKWKTPAEFPCCPQESSDNPIDAYVANLKIGELFSRNKYSGSIILDFALSMDKTSLLVMCKSSQEGAIKPWSLAKVTHENDLFVHLNLGGFFKEISAQKRFTLAQGFEWTGEDSIDDYS